MCGFLGLNMFRFEGLAVREPPVTGAKGEIQSPRAFESDSLPPLTLLTVVVLGV